MSKPSVNAAPAAPPPIEVRSPTGELWKRVAAGAAETLVARGWGEWLGTGRRRYVRLTLEAPVSSLVTWRGRDGTRPVRADRSCKIHADGQFVGDPRRNREFAPPAKWTGNGN